MRDTDGDGWRPVYHSEQGTIKDPISNRKKVSRQLRLCSDLYICVSCVLAFVCPHLHTFKKKKRKEKTRKGEKRKKMNRAGELSGRARPSCQVAFGTSPPPRRGLNFTGKRKSRKSPSRG